MSQTQTASLHEQEAHGESEKKVKSRRPANTAFRQQRLKAWQPILTPKSVIPLFFVVGVIFTPIGGLLLYASSQVQELVLDYSNCAASAARVENASSPWPTASNVFMPADSFSSYFTTETSAGDAPLWRTWNESVTYLKGTPTADVTNPAGQNVSTQVCQLQFHIPDTIGPPVFLYYRLTNFYQNHRKYVKSFDANQLAGQNNSPLSNCAQPTAPANKSFYPCGLIANSMFNDTIYPPEGVNIPNFAMTNKSIAWASDAQLYGKTTYGFDQILPPPYWAQRWPSSGYTADNPPPDLSQYEEFQVWMRTAGLPDFSKLALRNDTTAMPDGSYRITINSNFPVVQYGGTKSLVISTQSVIGGRNPFLGIAYIIVGGLCIILGVVFTVARFVKPRKLGDHTYLTWNNDHHGTATATGVSRSHNDNA